MNGIPEPDYIQIATAEDFEWRCPVCGDLLGHFKNGRLKIEEDGGMILCGLPIDSKCVCNTRIRLDMPTETTE